MERNRRNKHALLENRTSKPVLTGTIAMVDEETIAAYDTQVNAYANFTKRLATDPALISFISAVRPGGTVLDVGCGPGNASAFMRNQGLRVDAIDASAEMVQLANANHNIGARQATFEDITEENVYDAVWANFSLLHAPAEAFPKHLAAISRALVNRGILHIGMKLGKGAARDKLGRFYSYYSKPELVRYLANAGFHVNTVDTGKDKGLAGNKEPWITILSQVQKT